MAGSKMQALPFQVLFDIFMYASIMMINGQPPQASTRWLLTMASKMCKNFIEPALAVLYYAPGLDRPKQFRALQDCLTRNPDQRKWVKHLHIEAFFTLLRKDQGHDPIDLAKFLRLTPNVKGIYPQIYGDDGLVKQTVNRVNLRARDLTYRVEVFDTLKAIGANLTHFKWNYFFDRNPENGYPWMSLEEIHNQPFFHSLKHLDVVWFHSYSTIYNRKNFAKEFVKAVNASPVLTSLKFQFSNLAINVDDRNILLSLPKTLKTVDISDCTIDSVMVCNYLAQCGQNILSLTLSYNWSVDLVFLGELSQHCPKLKKLCYDLSNYGTYVSHGPSTPNFTEVLPNGIIPTWPVTLQHIELVFLRGWDVETARVFFRSLLSCSDNLPDLRVLILKAIVGVGWKEGLDLRRSWVQCLNEAFKRSDEPDVASINSFHPHNLSLKRTRSKASISDEGSTNIATSANRLRRRKAAGDALSIGNNTRGLSPKLVSEPDTLNKWPVQGMCHTVNIRIEARNPTNMQFRGQDTGDYLPSEDEDDHDFDDGLSDGDDDSDDVDYDQDEDDEA